MKGKEGKKGAASLPIITIITLIVIMFFTPTTLGDGEIGVSFDPRPNEPPNAPSNPDPANGEEDVPIPAILEVYVYDETSSTVDVYFYNDSDDSLIGVDTDVPSISGGIATVVWTGLGKSTIYSWYAVADDSEYTTTSATWSFTTLPNQMPTADAGGPYSGTVDHTIVFDGSGSSDPDGSIVGYRWDFTNDGFWDTNWLTSATTTNVYTSTGTCTVKLEVKDDDDATDIDTASVTISPNQAPVADAGGPYSGKVGSSVRLDGSGSSDSDGSVVGYRWDFNNDGSWDTEWVTSSTAAHSYPHVGTYTVKLEVKDDDDATDIDTASVSISTNKAPVAEANGPYSGGVNNSIKFDASGSSDPDGSIVGYRWDFTNDGSWDTNWLNQKTTTHAYLKPGTYTVKLQVKDNDEATDTDTASVSITGNSWPTARAGGPYTAIINEPTTFDGSSSSDPDGSIVGYRWDFTDDGNWDTDWLSSPTTNHSYSSTGTYTVRLGVKDNDGAVDDASTTVSVFLSEPPVADANGPYYGLVDEWIEFNGSGSYDPDGEITSYLWDFGDNQTSDMMNPVHSYLAPVNYTVTLKVTDDTDIEDTHTTTANIRDEEEEPDEPDEEIQLPLSLQTIIIASIVVAIIAFIIVKKLRR